MIYIFIICFYNYYLQIQERLYLNKHTQKYVCIMINKCEIDSSNMVNHNVSYSKQRGWPNFGEVQWLTHTVCTLYVTTQV